MDCSVTLVVQPRKGLLTEILVLIEVELYQKDYYKSTNDIDNRNGQVFIAPCSYSFDESCTGGEVNIKREEIYDESPYSKYT